VTALGPARTLPRGDGRQLKIGMFGCSDSDHDRSVCGVVSRLGDISLAFDLEGKAHSFRMSNSGWLEVLAIAEEYGWKPAGTKPPKGMKRGTWDGGYHTMDGQVVTGRDAQALASAIDDAIKDDFQRVRKAGTQPNAATESERQQAFEKMAAVASGMTLEDVTPRKKPASKAKRKQKPEDEKQPGSLEELVASKGLSMEELMGALVTLRSPPAGAKVPDPWFSTPDGLKLLRDFAAFCRTGECRIL
jgi:hypothetical protein